MSTRPASAPTRCWRCGRLPGAGEPVLPCPRCGTGAAPDRPRRRGPFAGLTGFLRGFRFLGGHSSLWIWVLIPLVLNGVVLGLVFFSSWEYARGFVPDMTVEWWPWIDWLRQGLAVVLPALMQVVVFLAALMATLLVSSIVNAPFYDILSEKVEIAALERPDLARPWSKFPADALHALWTATYLALRQIVVMLVFFVLSFTAIGAPLFVIACFFFTGYALADIPLARKRYGSGARVRWARRHWAHLVGHGLPVNVIPVLAPFSIVASTLDYLEDTEKG